MALVKTFDAEIDGDFADSVRAWQWFLEIVNELPGVTVLATAKHDFPGGGMSGVVIIGESHAAIHTWPELGKAWVELATCGDPAALDIFAVRRKHALHSFYWISRCLFGSDNEKAFFPSMYHKFLVWDLKTNTRPIKMLDDALNNVFGKSVVFYARKDQVSKP